MAKPRPSIGFSGDLGRGPTPKLSQLLNGDAKGGVKLGPAATHFTGQRGWMRIDARGKISNVQVDKHGLVVELGVPYRDLRMLDPLVPMPYPSSIFIREKAIIVNLESIRMLICESQVYVLSVPAAGQPGHGRTPDPEHYFIKDLVVRLQAGQVNDDGSPLNRESMNMPLDRHMPYELKALECALAVAVRILSRDCAELDDEARSPLERLTHKVTKADLQRVRNVKAIMNKLMNRVGRIKSELERILDDDNDMADMYLGRRRHLEALEAMTNPTSPRRMPSGIRREDFFGPAPPDDFGKADGAKTGAADPITVPVVGDLNPRHRSFIDHPADTDEVEFRPHSAEEAAAILSHIEEIRRGTTGVVDPHDIEACEALLESYFMQVDYLMNGLVMLKEHVDDTEDLINIELDNRRNELVALNMVVGVATASLTVIASVASIFGMNLYPLPVETSANAFIAVVVGACGTALLVFLSVIGYARWKRLLFMASPASMHTPSSAPPIPILERAATNKHLG